MRRVSLSKVLSNLNDLPQHTNQILYKIKSIDRTILQMKIKIDAQREEVIRMICNVEEKKEICMMTRGRFKKNEASLENKNLQNQCQSVLETGLVNVEKSGGNSKIGMERNMKEISELHHQMLQLTNEKIELAQQLFSKIVSSKQFLQKQISKYSAPEEESKQIYSTRSKLQNSMLFLSTKDSFMSSETYYNQSFFSPKDRCDMKSCQSQSMHKIGSHEKQYGSHKLRKQIRKLQK